jgi:hypothetical protein
MSKAIITTAIVMVFMAACGPEAADDDGDDTPRGVLVYEHPASELYRLDRRIEVVSVDPMRSRDGCGYLTDRAHDDLETTIDALDPTVDYGEWTGCLQTHDPKGLVHLDGFAHSPFVCDWDCCHPDLGRVSLVYFIVENNLFDQQPVVDDEPYFALEPGRPCE